MTEKVQLSAKNSKAKEKLASTTKKTESSQSISSPVDQVIYLQRTIGNQAVQRLIKSGTLQGKLKIGQPGDKYEQEADRVGDAVMRMPEPQVQRQVEPEEEEELIQTKSLVEQITPLVQRQVEEEKALQRSLKELEPLHPMQPDRMPLRLAQMRPGMRFHSSDHITLEIMACYSNIYDIIPHPC